MLQSEKKLKELSAILYKDNNILISEAIELLREEQPFKGAIGLLVSCYDKTNDNQIRKNIERFMNDLKDQSACEEVIHEVRKQWKASTTSMLVSSCWQSGLDYSEYSGDLIKAFIDSDYVTAIECLTVIEESVHELTRKKKDELIKMLEDNPTSAVNEKTALTLEMITILEK